MEELLPKLHLELVITVGLVLHMCEPLFSMVKSIVMNSGFFVANVIVSLAAKGLYACALIKKRRYWPKSVRGDLIDRKFAEKEVGDVDMLEAAIEYGKPFRILCFKEPGYMMNITEPWMTLDELEGANKKRNYKGRNFESIVKEFKYQKPFGLHFCYRRQVDNHNNRRHSHISLERT